MNNKEGLEQLKLIYKIFMDEMPLEEIDHSDIRLICKSYRNDNSSEDSCKHLFKNILSIFTNGLMIIGWLMYFTFADK